MTGDSDGIIDHLLFSVALSTTEGLSASAFIDAVNEFHSKDVANTSEVPQDDQDNDIFLSLAPPKRKVVLDFGYLRSLWAWLEQHGDVSIVHISADAAARRAPYTPDQERFVNQHATERFITTDLRIWHALTGHGPDWKRVPKLEFQCLCVIASHGPPGVLQPDLVKITDQDKRSVPKRTDALAKKGYISKEACIGGGSKTSLLRLTKFAAEAQSVGLYHQVDTETARIKDADNKATIVFYEHWFDIVIDHLQKQSNHVARADSIREQIIAKGNVANRRHLNSCLKRLAAVGLILRVKVLTGRESSYRDVDAMTDERGQKYVRCLKLLRNPVPGDRDAFTASVRKDSQYKTRKDIFDDEVDYDTDDEILPEGDAAEELIESTHRSAKPAESEQAAKQAQTTESSVAPVPGRWDPDIHYSNTIYDIVESFGVEGATSHEIGEAMGGMLWRRPLDEALGRLTDYWHISQPPELRHLTILRDTSITGVTTSYKFRTWENFAKAVKQGTASWEYMVHSPDVTKALRRQPDLDEWGFPRVPRKDIYDPHASVARCAASISRAVAGRAAADGEVQFISHNTEEPNAGGTSTDAGSATLPWNHKRGRGRPPKRKHHEMAPMPAEGGSALPTDPDQYFPPPKRRGRPPNSKPSYTAPALLASAPIVPATMVQAPTMPSPTMPGPTMPGPTMPGPTMPGPTMPGPTVPATGAVGQPSTTQVPPPPKRPRGRPPNLRPPPWSINAGAAIPTVANQAPAPPKRRGRPPKVRWPQPAGTPALVRWPESATAPASGAMPANATSTAAVAPALAATATATPSAGPAATPITTSTPRRTGRPPKAVRFNPTEGFQNASPLQQTSSQSFALNKWEERYEELSSAWDARYTRLARKLVTDETSELMSKRLRVILPADSTQQALAPDTHNDTDLSTALTSWAAINQNTSETAPSTVSSIDGPHGTKRTHAEHENNGTASTDIEAVADELKNMARPGVYIDQPRAFLIMRDSKHTKGRPRNALMATFKSAKLAQLPWFQHDRSAAPSAHLLSQVPDLRRGSAAYRKVANMFGPHLSGIAGQLPQNRRTEDPPQRIAAPVSANNNDSQPSEPAAAASNAALNNASYADPEISRPVTAPIAQLSAAISVPQHPTETTSNSNQILERAPHVQPHGEITTPAQASVSHGGNDSIVTEAETIVEYTAQPANLGEAPLYIDPSLEADTMDLDVTEQRSINGTLNPSGVRVTTEVVSAPSVDTVMVVSAERATGKGPAPSVNTAPVTVAETTQGDDPSRTSGAPPGDVTEATASPVPEVRSPAHNVSRPLDYSGLDIWSLLKPGPSRTIYGAKRKPHPTGKRPGLQRYGGIIEFERSALILDIIRQCQGVFSGRNELFYPFASLWQKKHNQMADRQTLNRSLKKMIDSGKLKQMTLTYEDSMSNSITKEIFTEPSIQPDDSAVRNLQAKLQEYHPKPYIPVHLPMSDRMRSRLHEKERHGQGLPQKDHYPAEDAGYYQYDDSIVLEDDQPRVRLGMLDEEVRKGTEARQRARLREQRRDKIRKARLQGLEIDTEDELDQHDIAPEVQEMASEFRVNSYVHEPEAQIDRGPKGRNNFTKLLRLGPRQPAEPTARPLTTLKGMRERRAADKAKQTEQLRFVNKDFDSFALIYDNADLETGALDIRSARQVFLQTSGTFGTHPASRLVPKLQSQHALTTSAPAVRYEFGLQDIIHAQSSGPEKTRKPQYGDDAANAFDHEIYQVELWEKAAERANVDKSPIDAPAGFVNHFVSNAFEAAPDQKIAYFEEAQAPPRQSLPRTSKRKDSHPDIAPAAATTAQISSSRRRSQASILSRPPQTQGAMGLPPSDHAGLSTDLAPNPSRFMFQFQADPTITMPSPAPVAVVSEQAALELDDRGRVRIPRLPKSRGVPLTPAKASNQPAELLTGYDILEPDEDVPMTAAEDHRLIFAVTVVRTLLGGLQQGSRSINYAFVNQAMHFKYDGRYCRQHWNALRPKHEVYVEQLQHQFRQLYLKAYENDEIADLDMTEPELMDWAALTDWAQCKLSKIKPQSGNGLPATRRALDANYKLKLADQIYEPDIDDFFMPGAATTRLKEVVELIAFHDPLPSAKQVRNPTSSGTQDLLAQSWIRANVLTDAHVYCKSAAHQKLVKLGEETLARATTTMLGNKLIKGAYKKRSMPGRNFMITDELHILMPLPWQWEITLFVEAASFKTALDAFFLANSVDNTAAEDEGFKLDYNMSNAQAMVLDNLEAHERITVHVILPETDNDDFTRPSVKLSKWGFTEGSYKTMQIDQAKMKFELVVRPTSSYIHDIANPPIRILPVPVSKSFDEDGVKDARLPFWMDIHGGIMKCHLRDLTLTVLYMLIGRPGVGCKAMAKMLRDRFWEWELEVLMRWAEEAGLVKGIEVEGEVGWELGEWWWLVGRALDNA